MNSQISRRQMFACAGAALASSAAAAKAAVGAGLADTDAEPFLLTLNTGTIRGKKLPIEEEVDVTARAGYRGIEPWMDGIRRYVESGRPLRDLKKRIADQGLTVVSAIGFPQWIVDDDARRTKGLEDMRRDMDLVAQIGGRHIAAPPAGAHGTPDMDLLKVAERYRAVLELGRETGVVPQLEIWGSAKTLGRMGQAAFVAVEAGHPDACLLLDAYHIYRSGSSFAGLKLLSGAAMHNFHVNDYPADPPREEITDGHRVYPGDGVCPLGQILRDLYATGFRGALSLELFNREYWQQDALTIAKTGLEKTRAVVRKAFA